MRGSGFLKAPVWEMGVYTTTINTGLSEFVEKGRVIIAVLTASGNFADLLIELQGAAWSPLYDIDGDEWRLSAASRVHSVNLDMPSDGVNIRITNDGVGNVSAIYVFYKKQV
ncbi:hypothetical protein ES705_29537 [subsurface metagenome]